MSNFELIMCCILIPINFVLFYIAGRNDLFGTICASLKDWSDEMKSQSTKMGEWISVEDRLPKQGERVLATDGGFVGEMYINKRSQWQRYNVNDSALMMALDILWWMPLPEPPAADMKGG